jgi:hypothetical protein
MWHLQAWSFSVFISDGGWTANHHPFYLLIGQWGFLHVRVAGFEDFEGDHQPQRPSEPRLLPMYCSASFPAL